MAFIQKQEGTMVLGRVPLKNLTYFIKCTNLCSQIELYIENNLPLIVKYYVASLGEIKLYLATAAVTKHDTESSRRRIVETSKRSVDTLRDARPYRRSTAASLLLVRREPHLDDVEVLLGDMVIPFT